MSILVDDRRDRTDDHGEPRRLTLEEMRADLLRRRLARNHETDARHVAANPEGVSRNQNRGCHETYSYPGGSYPLLPYLCAARRARGSRTKSLRVPRLKFDASETAYGRMRSHLLALSLRALNDATLAGLTPPAVTELADALAEYVHLEASHLIYLHEPGEPRMPARLRRAYLDVEAVDRLCAWVANARLATWSPAWILTKRANGTSAKGVPKPKRSAAAIWADAERLAELAEYMGRETNAQLCARFAVSRSTLHRGLRELGGRSS